VLQLPMQWRESTGRSLAPANRDCYQTGLLMLVCADVIRWALPWMGPARLQLDRHGDGRLPRSRRVRRRASHHRRRPGRDFTLGQARLALARITMILAPWDIWDPAHRPPAGPSSRRPASGRSGKSSTVTR